MAPLMGQALGGVGEEAQVQLKAPIGQQLHDLSHGVEMGGLAVGGQAPG
jgi:hypothetical protein